MTDDPTAAPPHSNSNAPQETRGVVQGTHDQFTGQTILRIPSLQFNLENTFHSIRTQFVEPFKNALTHTLMEIGKGVQEVFNEVLQSDLLPALDEAMRAIAEHERAVRDDLYPELARRGWYLHDDLLVRDIALLVRYVKENRGDDLEYFMARLVERRIGEIRDATAKLWPDRHPILSDAFDAHTAGLFTLSIPTLLAQIDGVVYDMLEVSFFDKNRQQQPLTASKTKAVREAFEADDPAASGFSLYLLNPLEFLCSISYGIDFWRNARTVDAAVSPLNRHAVMHGLDVTYPRRENSLRCIMMLDFLCYVHEAYAKYKAAHSVPP